MYWSQRQHNRLKGLGEEMTEIVKIQIPLNINKIISERTEPIVKYNIRYLSFTTLNNSIERIVRDCYLQGLQDGFELANNKRNK